MSDPADINPFGDHDKPYKDVSEGETISLIPGGGSTWKPEPECEQETLFRGMSLWEKILKEHVEWLH